MASERSGPPTGRFVKQLDGQEAYVAFIPNALPPKPGIEIDEPLEEAIERASIALGRLDGITLLLPDPELFLYMFVRKEAVLSNQIEGTQSSLSDLLKYEHAATPGVPVEDVREASNYVKAMQHGLDRLRGGFPLSLRLLREIHKVLLQNARGSHKTPGEFRTSQNWIGGTRPGNARFVPPPPHEVPGALTNLEKFLHDEPTRISPLLKAGIAHVQFETIHPFLDGNGRLGRLLITFVLCAEGVLSQPLLYLSLYLKSHREQYYDALQRVRTHGEWNAWLEFYLEGIEEVARTATQTAQAIMKLFEADHQRIQRLGKAAGSAIRVHDLLKRQAIISIPLAAKALALTQPTVAASVERLVKLGIARESTGKQRDRQFIYSAYEKILNEGTELGSRTRSSGEARASR
jgi:Fic family protein